MSTYQEILEAASALQNDVAQTVYTNTAQLPYLKLAIKKIELEMQENNIPISNAAPSVPITVLAGVTTLKLGGVPPLPPDLVEIREVWESNDGGVTYTPMDRKEFIPQYLLNTPLATFNVWAWIDQELRVPPSTSDILLKLEYIKSFFTRNLTIDTIGQNIVPLNIDLPLIHYTAAFVAFFIGQNETRAQALEQEGDEALEKALNISVKGKQAIVTRRRPFRSNYRARRIG